MAADALFKPFSFKGMALKNRVVMAPMTRSFSPDGASIVFATDEGGTPNPRGGTFADVFTMQLGTNLKHPVTRSENLDGWPNWGSRQ